MNAQTLTLLGLSALCFTVWPFFMNQSRLHFVVAAFILNAVSAVVFAPFLKGAVQGNSFTRTAIVWGVGAGLLNGLGHYFYQQVVASGIEPARFITVLLVMMVVTTMAVAVLIHVVAPQARIAEAMTVKKIIGALFAIGAIVLLTHK